MKSLANTFLMINFREYEMVQACSTHLYDEAYLHIVRQISYKEKSV